MTIIVEEDEARWRVHGTDWLANLMVMTSIMGRRAAGRGLRSSNRLQAAGVEEQRRG